VVASEVRSLAQRSAAAAKEIKLLIGDSVEQVEIGSRLVDQAGATMTQIVDSVKNVTSIMNEIATASQEQTLGIEQIHQTVTQMDEITQQNAGLVEQAAAASQSLHDQVDRLAAVVAVFRLAGADTAAPAHAAHAARERLPAQRHEAAWRAPVRAVSGAA
jgi:methyl-accepting chemotaxis protein